MKQIHPASVASQLFSATSVDRVEFVTALLQCLLLARALASLCHLETRHMEAWRRQLRLNALVVGHRCRSSKMPDSLAPRRLSAALKLLLCICAYVAFHVAAVRGLRLAASD